MNGISLALCLLASGIGRVSAFGSIFRWLEQKSYYFAGLMFVALVLNLTILITILIINLLRLINSF